MVVLLITKSNSDCEKNVLLSDKSNLAIANALGEGNYTLAPSPVSFLKSIKNPVELEGFRQCHIRDGAALARYFAWLEEQLDQGKRLTEWEGAEKLEEFRSWVLFYVPCLTSR